MYLHCILADVFYDTPGPHLTLFLGQGKNLHWVEFARSETDPFQTNSLSQCDISSTIVEFVLN